MFFQNIHLTDPLPKIGPAVCFPFLQVGCTTQLREKSKPQPQRDTQHCLIIYGVYLLSSVLFPRRITPKLHLSSLPLPPSSLLSTGDLLACLLEKRSCRTVIPQCPSLPPQTHLCSPTFLSSGLSRCNTFPSFCSRLILLNGHGLPPPPDISQLSVCIVSFLSALRRL